jgi:hypothetical protein
MKLDFAQRNGCIIFRLREPQDRLRLFYLRDETRFEKAWTVKQPLCKHKLAKH